MPSAWDDLLAEKAGLQVNELRAYQAVFNQLDPQGEGEINVTKCYPCSYHCRH